MKSVFLALTMIVGLASVAPLPAMAIPDDEEVVGILYGKTYRYKDLAPSPQQREAVARYYKGKHLDKTLRYLAVASWGEMAFVETTRGMYPGCSLAIAPDEISEFADAWLGMTRKALDEASGSSNSYRDYPEATLSIDRQKFLLSDISADNEEFSTLAKHRIELWKANVCVHQTYGGNRIFRFSTSPVFLSPGEPSSAALRSLSKVTIPVGRDMSVPFGAYLEHFREAKKSGALAFPDVRYEQQLLGYYERSEPGEFFVIDDSASVLKRYWLR
jgi:hypothetical protein